MVQSNPAEHLLSRLSVHNARLRELSFAPPVHTVYNPWEYAAKPWTQYLRRYGAHAKEVLFMGMNPGPWGMAQTGIPFGEIAATRDWMGIEAPVDTPELQHPKRPVQGFACRRSEVSGRRLWGLFAETYRSPEEFFHRHLVINYCPLVFMAESGRNITPDKLPVAERRELFGRCDIMLGEALRAYQPRWVVGVGAFAAQRLKTVLETGTGLVEPRPTVVQILHPSPASPMANRGWATQAARQLVDAGVW